MDDKKRAQKIIIKIEKNYPSVPKLFLNYKTFPQMLCAIILSAQSTDAQVNLVTQKLFKKYKTVGDFANAIAQDFEKEIFSTGFYKNKTKNVINCFKKINSDFGGEIPKTMGELITLSGVGRKTANLLLLSMGKVEGIAVDTHVFRLARRMGLSVSKQQDGVEKDLMLVFRKNEWQKINKLFISHGRAICTAKKPFCSNCFLNNKKLCPRIGVLEFR